MIHIELENSSNRLGIIKLVIVAIIIVCFIVWERYFAPTLEEQTFEVALPMTFHGRINSIYRDKENHDLEKAIISDGFIYDVYRPWEKELELGDSLSKAKGSLKVEVYKKNQQSVILDYRQLVKGFSKAWWQR